MARLDAVRDAVVDPEGARSRTEPAYPLGASGDRGDPFGFDVIRFDRMMQVAELYFRWLRVRVDGLENVPSDGSALLVGNHYVSGHDVLALQYAVRRLHPSRRIVRPLMAWSMGRLVGYGRVTAQYCGCVIGHPRNADYLLQAGDLVAVYPEGMRAAAKGSDGDELCPPGLWGAGFVRTAMINDVPIIPIASHGFGRAFPLLGHSRTLAKLRRWRDGPSASDGMRRPHRVSPQTLLTAGVPLLEVALPLPVRCAISVLDPIQVPARGSLMSADAAEEMRDVALEIRRRIESRLEVIARSR